MSGWRRLKVEKHFLGQFEAVFEKNRGGAGLFKCMHSHLSARHHIVSEGTERCFSLHCTCYYNGSGKRTIIDDDYLVGAAVKGVERFK